VKKSQEHSKTELKTIQSELKSIKLYDGNIDGLIGPQTRSAIRTFEKQEGLFPNAFLTLKERTKLSQLSIKKQSVANKATNNISQSSSKDKVKIKQLEDRIEFLSDLSGKRLKIINGLRKNDNSSLQKFETEINVLKRNAEYFANLASDRLVIINKLESQVNDQPDDNQLRKRVDFLDELASERLRRIKNLVKQYTELEKEIQDQSKNIQSGPNKVPNGPSHSGSKDKARIKQLEDRIEFYSDLSRKRLKIINGLRKNANSGSQKLETEINVLKKNTEYFANLASDRLVEINKLKTQVNNQPDDNQLRKRADFLDELANERMKRIKILVNQYTKLEVELNELRKRQNEASSQLETFDDRVAQLKEADKFAADRLKEINDLKKEKIDIAKQYEASKQNNQNVLDLSNQQAEQINKQKYELAAKDAKIASLEEKLENSLTLIKTATKLEQQIKVLRPKLQKLKTDSTKQKDELILLRSQLENSQKENETLNKSFINLKTDTQAKKNEKEELLEIIANLKSEIATLNEQSAGDRKSKFNLSDEWVKLERWVPAQQLRFCSILSEYSIAADEAATSMNQLKQNAAVTLRDENMQALLLPSKSGANSLFQNWIAKVEKVFVINLTNGGIGAGIVLRTPCEVTIGSGAQVVNEEGSFKIEEFRAIALPDEPIFKQLEQLSNGDTVIINGGFVTYGDGKDLSKFITNVDGIKKRLVESERPDNAPDYFVDITYLSQL